MISIHVPTWGTTENWEGGKRNPPISIHVPTWGTTQINSDHIRLYRYFNSRSHVGNDNINRISPIFSIIISIHVPTWGTTDRDWLIFSRLFYFNSRSHVGNDRITEGSEQIAEISIHVPTWGTTDIRLKDNVKGSISIHVPTWGTTTWSAFLCILIQFQFTFPRGERQVLLRR